MILKVLKQRKRNKEIESDATGLEKKAIELINYYAGLICDPEKKVRAVGHNLPPSTPRPHLGGSSNYVYTEKDYSQDYLAMKSFLEDHKDYQTSAAKKIRQWYNLG